VGALFRGSTEWSSLCVCLLRSAADLLPPHIQAVSGITGISAYLRRGIAHVPPCKPWKVVEIFDENINHLNGWNLSFRSTKLNLPLRNFRPLGITTPWDARAVDSGSSPELSHDTVNLVFCSSIARRRFSRSSQCPFSCPCWLYVPTSQAADRWLTIESSLRCQSLSPSHIKPINSREVLTRTFTAHSPRSTYNKQKNTSPVKIFLNC